MNRPLLITGDREISQLRGYFTHKDGLSLSLNDTAGENHYLIPVNQGIGPLLRRNLNDPLPEWASIPYHIGSFLPRRLLPDGKTRSLRNGCWVYLFRNGYLWREIRTPLESAYTQLNDVNLATQFGKDQRLATCTGSSGINIPYCINEQMPEYRLIFSEIQLSWAQLVALGGLHAEDPRNPDGEDQQTAETLQQLEARSSLLQLTKDLGYVRSTNLEGSGQPDYPPPDVPSNLDFTYLCIADPLQDARDLKATHDEQLSLLAHCMESRQSGPLALAALIENLTANGDPNKLERHLASDRHDRALLQAVRELEDQLPDRILAAEQALVDYLQTHETPLLAVLSDYLQDQPQAQQLGLLHLSLLTSDWSAPASLDWLYTRLNEPAEPNSLWYLAQGEDKNLLEHLRQEAGKEQGSITPDHPLLQGQQNNDPWLLATLASNLLVNLIENHDLVLGHHYKQDTATLMAAVASRFTKLSGIRARVVTNAKLDEWLPAAITPQTSRGYRYLPQQLIQQIKTLGNISLPQILPEGHASLREFLRTIDTTREGNLQMLRVFGPLLVFNMIHAIQKADEDSSTTNLLERNAAIASFLKFGSDRLKRIYPALNQPASIQATKPQTRINKITIVKSIQIGIVRFLFKLINLAAITAEIALSGWHLLRASRTGNTGIMVASSLALMSGLVALVAAPLAMTPLFWIAVCVGLGASLIRPWLEYNALEAAIRFSWLGNTPYPEDESCPFEAPALPNWQEQRTRYIQSLQLLAQDMKLYAQHHQALTDCPDLSAELNAIQQPLFNFSASIQIMQPGEYRPFGNRMRLEPIWDQQALLVELRVELGQFTPFDSLIQGHINLGFRHFNLDEAWIHEDYRTLGDPPRTVSFYWQAPRTEMLHNITAHLWLDPNGNGQQLLPDQNGLQLRYNPASNPNERRIHTLPQDEWEQLLKQAQYRAPTAQPRHHTLHTLAESIEQARLLPLFNANLQGAH